mgnify:CR=1 FL=1
MSSRSGPQTPFMLAINIQAWFLFLKQFIKNKTLCDITHHASRTPHTTTILIITLGTVLLYVCEKDLNQPIRQELSSLDDRCPDQALFAYFVTRDITGHNVFGLDNRSRLVSSSLRSIFTILRCSSMIPLPPIMSLYALM